MGQTWKKLGLLLTPKPDIYWMSHYAGPCFIKAVDDTLLVYVTGRDKNNISRIGLVEVGVRGEEVEINSISPKPVFDIGEAGLFDEDGVSYPWLVEYEEKIFMFYVGWQAGGKTRFLNFTGLAISEDKGRSFQRIQSTPILDRTDKEPYGSGSCCVFIEKGLWKMYYTAFGPWEYDQTKYRPHYVIRYASSSDGKEWTREQREIVGYSNPQEYVIGKPMLVKDQDLYRLWYSCRGDHYRIGYAESTDGMKYVRKDSHLGLDVSPSGWDSQMTEYAFVFDLHGKRYMAYNGNDFGKTGLGLAVLT